MIGMARYPDKYFDLAVVDPPYGIGAGKGTEIYLSNNGKQDWGARNKNKKTIYGEWDNAKPSDEYFKEVFRVSKNQIIWGGNYFPLSETPCWIIWDKLNGESFFADGEMAWTSFKSKLRIFKYLSCGFMGSHKNRDERIHPTQKPVALYDWIYKNYLPNGGKVIDTHLGSGSNRIAANKAGNIDFVGFELYKDYYEAQEKRWKAFISQTRLF